MDIDGLAGSDMEYGYDDAEDALLADILQDIQVQASTQTAVLDTIEAHVPSVHLARKPSSLPSSQASSRWKDSEYQREGVDASRLSQSQSHGPNLGIEYDLGLGSDAAAAADTAISVAKDESPGLLAVRFEEPTPDPEAPLPAISGDADATTPATDTDTRSPLTRFRTLPRKPLSVTDLISPAWCELQYWYTLIRFGKKRATPSMKRGSSVHKTLEEQVHVTVPVDTLTKEDAWGLRLWNVIQGLRTLRCTGMTREIEVWGVLDGQIVNGIIDELSYDCPDPSLEAMIDKKVKKQAFVPPNQATIGEFFQAKKASDNTVDSTAMNNAQKVYLMDVKTRGRASIPPNASMRTTHMQLMVYRKLLADMASISVDASLVFARYRLNPEAHFSDTLIQQLGGLEMNFDPNSSEDTYAPMESNVDAVIELLQHNNLMQLWQLMIQEYQMTMPSGADSVSKVLKVEFRQGGDGSYLGARTFAYLDDEIDDYLRDEMSWWKGEREARGVDVEEAYKCRICEFADDCSWRINKIEEAVEKHRLRSSKPRKKSAV